MDAIEIVAANLDEARDHAAAKLGIAPDEVKLTVLEETKGLFGKPGKLKVRAEAGKAKPAAKAKPEKAPAKAKEQPAEEPMAVEPEPVIEKPAKPTRSAKPVKAKAEAAPAAAEEAPSEEEAPEADRPSAVATEEDGERIVTILNSLLEKANLRAEAVVSSLNGRYVNIGVDGRDVGYLVGRRGEVLNALQYLMNVVTSRSMQSGVRVTIDGDNYRKRREEALTRLALEIAEQVKERGEEAVLDALPAFERRVVHQALVDFDGVQSYSEGEEPNRRVVIGPA